MIAAAGVVPVRKGTAMADDKITLANQQKTLLDGFKKLDTENSGAVHEEEVKALLLKLDALTDPAVEELMNEVSVSSDGAISYDSFVNMLVTGYPLASA